MYSFLLNQRILPVQKKSVNASLLDRRMDP